MSDTESKLKALEYYNLVNSAETWEQLEDAIKTIGECGIILGRKKTFETDIELFSLKTVRMGNAFNVLTRSYGIRQQAMYIFYYTKLEKANKA